MVSDHIALREIEKCVVLQQRVLKVIALQRRDHHIGRDAAAAIDGASAIGEFHLAVGVAAGFGVAVVVVIVKRNVAIVALDQATTRRVVVSRGEGEAGILRQRINGLNQALAERHFTDDQAAIMILNRSGNNFRRRGSQAIYQNDERIILATIAVLCDITFFCRRAAVVRNDDLTLLQELVSHAYAFAQQPARIASQIDDQTLKITKLVQSL